MKPRQTRQGLVVLLSTAMSTIAVLAGCGGTSALPTDASAEDTRMGIETDTASSDSDARVEVDTDAPGHCGYSGDHASIRVYLGDGSVSSCNPPGMDGSPGAPTADGGPGAPAAANTLRGTITGGDASTLVIDACDSSQSCVPSSIRIEIDAPGLDLTSVPRVGVEIKFEFTFFRTCQQSLEITTTDSVDGSASAVPAGQLLLAVVDGGLPLTGSPYRVDRVPLGCFSAKGCGSPVPDVYAFDFSMASVSGSTIRVYMGETNPWTTGGRSYRVRNLRSFQSTVCDDYWNFAHYIVAAPS